MKGDVLAWRRLVGGSGFEKIGVVAINLCLMSFSILHHYGNFLDDASLYGGRMT